MEEGSVRCWLLQNTGICGFFILGVRTIFLRNSFRLKVSVLGDSAVLFHRSKLLSEVKAEIF